MSVAGLSVGMFRSEGNTTRRDKTYTRHPAHNRRPTGNRDCSLRVVLVRRLHRLPNGCDGIAVLRGTINNRNLSSTQHRKGKIEIHTANRFLFCAGCLAVVLLLALKSCRQRAGVFARGPLYESRRHATSSSSVLLKAESLDASPTRTP